MAKGNRNLLHTKISEAYSACRSALLNIGLFSCCINLLMLTGPLFMLQVYDRVLTSRSVPTLIALTFLVIGLYAFMGLLEFIRSRMLVRIGRRVDEQIGSGVFDKVIFHALNRTPGVNAQPLRDLDTLRQFLSSPGPATLFDTPWVPIYLCVIFLMHTWLGLLATLGAVVLFVFALLNEILTRQRFEDAAQSSIAAHRFAEESRRNAEVVKAMGMLSSMRTRWQMLRENAIGDHDQASDRGTTITSSSKVIRLFLQSAVLALGAYLAILQEITPGVMIASSIIMSRALAPLEQSIAQWRGFLNFRRAKKRLDLIFSKTVEPDEQMELPQPEGHIHAENLIVPAPNSHLPLLQGIDFKLEPGQVLGIVGPTGAGKSTLARVMVGVWPVAKGEMRIDGAPIEQWNPEQLGKAIGYLPQDVELFDGTIEENISRFSLNANPGAVIKAAKLANVHDMILRLPEGYNTKIGEHGAVLSAGQRQRVGLARALYDDPVFIVLDEPNSNLDMEGEAALVEAVQTMKRQKKAVIIIAHRPSAIKIADFLLCIIEGQQKAFGLRDDVLRHLMPQLAKQE
ncbi:MAG: type I secretion system permease/ATPase [Pseudomonadota bacterium]